MVKLQVSFTDKNVFKITLKLVDNIRNIYRNLYYFTTERNPSRSKDF